MKKIISQQKGFTLMEIVFVILVIALIVSFALPAFRKVRFDIKNSRAKSAVLKLAEARRSFYQRNKGWDITVGSSFTGAQTKGFTSATCTNPSKYGVPPSGTTNTVAASQLFACGFLDWRDFADLPYTFYICDNSGSTGSSGVCNDTYVYAGATGTDATSAGSKYAGSEGYWIRVYSRVKAKANGGNYAVNIPVDSED
ncbi:MAG: prepilin-type N-terminal cleavage/methylation domain-containing protein [Elusimicrobiaceae bacterium]|nr:prepilin-type N-terminal cleavage/methylation domain-containing protein [Elusimicrobiaceae bacterium]